MGSENAPHSETQASRSDWNAQNHPDTEEQRFERQLSSTQESSEREFGADLADLRIYRDKSTGTNTDRMGYQEIADVEAGALRGVVVLSISRICRSISELERTASRLESCGVALQ